MNTTFIQALKTGKVGESLIAEYFRSKGYNVLPVYEVVVDSGKGPQLLTPDKQFITPDMLIFKMDKCFWVEAKHKTAFTWHRITNRWVTGIDLRHYEHYCEVDDCTPWPVWLMFLHGGGKAKDSPPDSPAGLFGNTLKYLREHENHRSNKWGKSGMVYWDKNSLKKICDYEDCILSQIKNLSVPAYALARSADIQISNNTVSFVFWGDSHRFHYEKIKEYQSAIKTACSRVLNKEISLEFILQSNPHKTEE